MILYLLDAISLRN